MSGRWQMLGKAEAYRVFFGLAAAWAALSVPIWHWRALPQVTLEWHVSELVLGFVAALIAGYTLTACSAWSGRGPSRGGVIVALAMLWLGARAAMMVPHPQAEIIARALNAVIFATIAVLVCREWLYGLQHGRRAVVPPLVIGVCLVLGTGALVLQNLQPQFLLVPVWLVMAVGSRMLIAFLNAAAHRLGEQESRPNWPFIHAALVLLGVAFVVWDSAPPSFVAALLMSVALCLTGFITTLGLTPVRHDALLLMMTLALCCIPAGLFIYAGATLGWPTRGPGTSGALHFIAIGGLSCMGIAVMARASALRHPGYLKARRGAVIGFYCVFLAAILRMSDALSLAATSWSIGWGLVLVAHLQACRQPVPHPVFSANILTNSKLMRSHYTRDM
ncbi:NnrS family protein [Roseinatronobacter bogoriensis]|nr:MULTISPECIES: NnrS family protein [Rhodobaca]MBB4208308.1 uncharacterized protein involved in response to NO [Rhodobaca bogoriensis DSM 18756]